MLSSHNGSDCLCFRRKTGKMMMMIVMVVLVVMKKERKGGPIIETRDQKLSVFIIAESLKRGILQIKRTHFRFGMKAMALREQGDGSSAQKPPISRGDENYMSVKQGNSSLLFDPRSPQLIAAHSQSDPSRSAGSTCRSKKITFPASDMQSGHCFRPAAVESGLGCSAGRVKRSFNLQGK